MELGPPNCCPREALNPQDTGNWLDSGPLGGLMVCAGGLCTGWVWGAVHKGPMSRLVYWLTTA